MPEAFYKYMTHSTANIVLENQTLRWSTPATLNDPYDIQFDLRVDFDRNKVLHHALDKLWKVFTGELTCHADSQMSITMNILRPHLKRMPKKHFINKMEEGIRNSFAALDTGIHKTYQITREHLSTAKILCLTDSPTNQLMWAYYADSNRGVVLRFQDEPGAGSPYQMAKQMSYMPDIPMLFEESELSDFLARLITFDTQKRIHSLIYTKSDAWKHENEWRIFAGDGRNKFAPHEDKPFGARELTGAIFGCRMPPEQKTALSLTIRRLFPHAEILQAVPAKHSFQLELVPFCEM
ncbi:DUF2971 domain-containing protein [Pseudomonas sp. D1HM]|uniref:DUF2971 domain-containing protein n=1 Tax=Pseudomonas sp. D1HM TaxID=1784816 RepID=UPI001C4EA964|nr:DUF2971 domain-containing protein [Pseudomonas sp. D1HM]